MAAITTTRPANFSLIGFLKLTRVGNLLIIVFAQYFTAYFLLEEFHSITGLVTNIRLFLLSLSTVLIAAAGYIINDYYDVKIDLINKPRRVVVGKVLKRRVAMVAHTLLNVAGVGIGFILSWKLGVINFLSATLLWWYSNYLKRTPFFGNLVVAVLTGLSIYIIGLYFNPTNLLVLIYTLFAFTFTLLREIIKDMEDLRGDQTFGCHTLPVVYGLRKSKYIVYTVAVTGMVALCWVSLVCMGYRMFIFTTFLALPVSILIYHLARADTMKQFAALSSYCKIVMLLGILSMVFF